MTESPSPACLQSSWQRAWHSLGLQPASGLHAQLLEAYRETQRHYHTLQHLQECLTHWEQVMQRAQFPGELELALWFHDAVYAVKAKDNEAQSAQWAKQALRQSGASAEQIQRVQDLIMATCHQAVPSAADAQLLVDIDLAILGADPQRFAEYDAQVRAEYSWVPGWIYRGKRRQVMRGFLARDAIYSTPHFQTQLEAQARRNLAVLLG
ncbi:putative metal-dependent HD superfamily phosphohydrolase [Paucibacter oligotrophus]|uniref:Putative metal-dependent HD superfamily phosphohydrolase n=1 Tax=Roseateles oligotrophus TaxID=1769250 RepID=A0A840LI36_9BURK|nr:N-methyl-D-aspartate receptor NMDAR2C subunit [Roseateles oligotrophus]MBB4845669.1 putative metal-dependent HD superfamily phosphohydrolase [Roseateles oligotrophus]